MENYFSSGTLITHRHDFCVNPTSPPFLFTAPYYTAFLAQYYVQDAHPIPLGGSFYRQYVTASVVLASGVPKVVGALESPGAVTARRA